MAASHPAVEEQATPAAPAVDRKALVSSILQKIEGSDNGQRLTDAEKHDIDARLDQLAAIGAQQQPRPLDNELLWGDYIVAYTSQRRSADQGEAAGGRFRGPLGRFLFRTEGLFQSVHKPDLATNKVSFRMFGFIPGYVGLRGKVFPEGGDSDTVRVLFEPAVLSLLGGLVLARIGPPSSVLLKTTYLDERVRIGQGSRGSLFVFTRGGAADQADMQSVGLERASPAGFLFLLALLSTLVVGGAALWQTELLPARVAAVGMWLISVGTGLVLRRGGLVDNNRTVRNWQEYQTLLARQRAQAAGGQAEQQGQPQQAAPQAS